MENAGASAEEIESFIGYGRAHAGQLEGNLVDGEAYCGAIAGMIKEIKGAGEVVQDIANGYEAVLSRL